MSKILSSRTRRSARVAAARSMAAINNESHRPVRQPLATVQKKSKNPKKKPPTQEREKPAAQCQNFNIFSLNDDCVLKLFSYLKRKDLYAISETCQHFHRLAFQVASRKFRRDEVVQLPKLQPYRAYQCGPHCENHYLNHGREILCSCFHYQAIDEEAAAMLLIKFGKSITNLHIVGCTQFRAFCDRYAKGHSFITMINNCTSLKCLKLEKIQFRNRHEGLKTILHTIESLELVDCGCLDVNLAQMLKGAQRLKHITLVKNTIFQQMELFLAIARLEQLESLRITDCGLTDITSFRLTQFCGKLKKLKKLKKLELDAYHITFTHLEQIAKIDALEELTFRHYATNNSNAFFGALGNFENLKVCRLHMYSAMYPQCLAVAEIYFVVTVSGRNTNYTYTLVPK